MPPKRKSLAAAAAASPRKTRSMAAGKPAAPPPATVKKEAAEQKGRKRAKKEAEAAATAVEVAGGVFVGGGKRVVVEACSMLRIIQSSLVFISYTDIRSTQCRQFKIRALKVKEDLESAVAGVSVTINPEKPRRGCLEIREEGGEVFISLLNMPRPFTAMKKLDMDEVIKDIAKKIS